ncbi:MAG: chaperone NapD [Propionivibrio sp.]
MNLASLVLRIQPERRVAAEAALTALPGVECHAMSDDGKLIVTVEETPQSSVAETLIAVHGVPEVLAVTLAYEHNPHLSSFPDSDPSTLTPATHSPCEEVQP